MNIGDYGTIYNPGEIRLAVRIANKRYLSENYIQFKGEILSSPGRFVTFDSPFFIPRGQPGGMMLLEQQIEEFEKHKRRSPLSE